MVTAIIGLVVFGSIAALAGTKASNYSDTVVKGITKSMKKIKKRGR